MEDWVGTVTDVATAGGFCALVWYLIVKHIPRIEDRHQLERKQLVEDMMTRFETMHKDLVSLNISYQELVREVMKGNHGSGKNKSGPAN